eukprot:1156458-Pelagomonas_calceolata.AAC.7
MKFRLREARQAEKEDRSSNEKENKRAERLEVNHYHCYIVNDNATLLHYYNKKGQTSKGSMHDIVRGQYQAQEKGD